MYNKYVHPSSVKHSYLGHRGRLRDRWITNGMGSLQDYEILELILTYALPRIDTKPLAKALIKEFGSLTEVFDANADDLSAVKGIGPRAAQLIALFKPACSAYLKEKSRNGSALENPKKVADYCRAALSGKSHEVVLVLFTDIKNHIIAEQILSMGSIAESPLYPRRLVEEALAFRAAGFILVHNHPSGRVEPSPADKALTRRIMKVAESLDLHFLDHVIVGAEGYYSFRAEGLLDRLSDKALAGV